MQDQQPRAASEQPDEPPEAPKAAASASPHPPALQPPATSAAENPAAAAAGAATGAEGQASNLEPEPGKGQPSEEREAGEGAQVDRQALVELMQQLGGVTEPMRAHLSERKDRTLACRGLRAESSEEGVRLCMSTQSAIAECCCSSHSEGMVQGDGSWETGAQPMRTFVVPCNLTRSQGPCL